MKYILPFIVSLLFAAALPAQLTMQNGTFNVCSGTFTDSGGSTGDYSNNESTVMTLCSNSGNCIQVDFTSFNTESCCDDLTIYDGPSTASPVIGTFAGTALPNGGTVTSTTGCLTFEFNSDFSVVSSGWVANISCVACPPPPPCLPNMSTCSVNACSGDFFDSGGSALGYGSNENFVKTICSNSGNCVSVTFSSFNTESCCDFLTVYDGATTGSPVIGTYSGTALPNGGTITSTSGCLTFEFTSDGSVTSAGWAATISCGVCPPAPGCLPNMSTCTVNDCSSNFFDSGGNGGDYSNSENLVKTVCGINPGDCNQVTFTAFNTEACCDFLSIYDGPSTASPLIGTYSGTALPNGGTITSSSGCLTFEYTSDGSVVNPGWEASFSCLPCPPPAGTCTAGLPDSCDIACWLGILPTPSTCDGSPGEGTGATVSFNYTNIGATAQNPYVYQNACQTGGGMDAPAADVWYQFQASGTRLDVNITSLLNDMNVGLWEGSCASLIGRGCAESATGNLSATFEPLTPGQTYYLQVSGQNTLDQGLFTLTLNNDNDCNSCFVNSSITASPPPVGGLLPPNTPITFCFEVTSWNSTAVNWLHGVVPTFGPGWQMPSLSFGTPPASCDGVAVWEFHNSVTSTFSGNTYGPGFFAERNSPSDGNPGNNFGDATTCAGRQFCWTITSMSTASGCVSGTDHSIVINTLGDSESGGWSSPGCATDPVPIFNAVVDCSILVEMDEFYGVSLEDANLLKWVTTFEFLNEKFVLERSADGDDFKELAEIEAIGFSDQLQTYEFLDENRFPGKNYYRLRTRNSNGEDVYSNVVLLEASVPELAVVDLYPNPVEDRVNLSLYSPVAGAYSIRVHDLNGRMLRETKVELESGLQDLTLEVNELPEGLYLVKIQDSGGNLSTTKRFVKQ